MASSIAQRIGLAVVVVMVIAVCLIGFILAYLTVTEYNPPARESVQVDGSASRTISANEGFDVVTWNIGYGGLSAQADFFMDGGSGVRSIPADGVEDNIDGIIQELDGLDPAFVFLQEVDEYSDRSFNMDERRIISDALAGRYSSAFALNYNVEYVPYPLPPIGCVKSGIMTLSSTAVESAERIQLPCPFDWPLRIGNLKRCLLVERIPVEGTSKELVMVNLHLEAYDDGEGKAEQTKQLADLIQREREQGNYVIAGGDFNQTFSNIDTGMYPLQDEDLWQCGYIEVESLGDGVAAVMDNTYPTCRSLDRPYDGSSDFQFYMIDGFIVSDNVRIDSLATLDTDFQLTDHNPVRLSVTLM